MATSQCFASTQPSTPSFDGGLIATVDASQLIISSSASHQILRSYSLAVDFAKSCRFIRWHSAGLLKTDASRTSEGRSDKGAACLRILLADDARIVVYDLGHTQPYAEISGASRDLGDMAYIDFGHTMDEVMAFSDFGLKLQIWSLSTRRSVEIKGPKTVSANYSYRPGTGHMAILTRPAAHDMLLILAPHTYEVLSSIELETVDARGVKYSPDGRWLAIWDAASAGCRLLIYTSDGHLFKMHSQPDEPVHFGIKCVSWSHDNRILALGAYDETVAIFKREKFSQALTFTHAPTIFAPYGIVWQEEIGPLGDRTYAETRQPAEAPTSEPFPKGSGENFGVSHIQFNSDGNMLATKSDAAPSTVWIWHPATGEIIATLIHHSPVKSIEWHPSADDLLLIHCVVPEPVIHLWRAKWDAQRIVCLPTKVSGGKMKASWLASDGDVLQFMLSNKSQSAIGRITHEGVEVPWRYAAESAGLGPEEMFDEGNSLDLSPVKMDSPVPDNTYGFSKFSQLEPTATVNDTFKFRHQSNAVI